MNPNDRLIQSEHRFKGGFDRSVFQSLWFSYRPFRFQLLLYFILGLLGRGILLANANVIGWWVDSLCQGERCRPIPTFMAGIGSTQFLWILSIMVCLGFILTLIFRVGFSAVSASAVSTFYDETTYRASRFPMSYFDSVPVGRVVTRFSSDYGNVFRLFGGPLAEFLSIVFDLTWILLLTTLAGWIFLPLLLGTGFLNYFIYTRNRLALRECRRELSASRSPSIAHFSETAQGASTIRTFNKQEIFSSRFKNLDQYYLVQKLRTTRAVVLFGAQMNGLTAMLFLTAAGLAVVGVNSGFLSVGAIGVAFAFITLSGNTVQMFFEWLTQFEEAMVGVERMNHYLRSPIEPGAHLPRQTLFPTAHLIDELRDEKERLQNPLSEQRMASVRFEDVGFRYAPHLPWIFRHLSFEVKPGERFGIIGRTGSGKSSLIQALFNLYPVEEGRITVGEHSPRLNKSDVGLDLRAFRRSLAFIAQDPTLFRGTLRDNLDIERSLSDEELFAVLHRVGLEDWATQAGLEKEIEEKGRNLSLGEKQLICLGRCLLQNAPVVIMDEATSSIDPRSEEVLVKATEEFFAGRTQLIIAHRLSTLGSCDRILWLQNGEVRKIGTPAEVLPEFEKANLS